MARQLDGDLEERAEDAKHAAEKAFQKFGSLPAFFVPMFIGGRLGPGLHTADSRPGG